MSDPGSVDPRAETPIPFSNLCTMQDEDLFSQLERPCPISLCALPKIQKVAHHLRRRQAFSHYYFPKMVSLGPIHHGEPHLKLGEQYKLMWASMYVRGDREKAQYLHRRIAKSILELKNLYSGEAIRHINDQQLTRILLVDGCALLQILKYPDILKSGRLKAKVDQMALVRQDALLLENQLPFRLLQLLSDLSDEKLIENIDKFLLCTHFSPGEKPIENRASEGDLPLSLPQLQCVINVDPCSLNPVHLLDELRKKVLREFHPSEPSKQNENKETITYRNLKELKAAGILVKRSKTKCPIQITFSSYCFCGILNLPDIIVDDTTAPTYLNLMAYEACPDFENKHQISSYVEFMDSIIDHADDVKELRRAQVLRNSLGSDEKVAELFNDISSDVVANAAIYASLRYDIEKRYQQRYKTWLVEAVNTHFSNPWSFIAFIAALYALFLASSQTWFTVFPRRSSN